MSVFPDVALVSVRLVFKILRLGYHRSVAYKSNYAVFLVFLIDSSEVESFGVTPLPVSNLFRVKIDQSPLRRFFPKLGDRKTWKLLVSLPGRWGRIVVRCL